MAVFEQFEMLRVGVLRVIARTYERSGGFASRCCVIIGNQRQNDAKIIRYLDLRTLRKRQQA